MPGTSVFSSPGTEKGPGVPGILFPEERREDSCIQTEHPLDLFVRRFIVIVERPGQGLFRLHGEDFRTGIAVIVPTELPDNKIEFVVRIKDRIAKEFCDVLIGFHASCYQIKVVPRIPENAFTQSQVAEESRRDVSVNYWCSSRIIDRVTTKELSFLPDK